MHPEAEVVVHRAEVADSDVEASGDIRDHPDRLVVRPAIADHNQVAGRVVDVEIEIGLAIAGKGDETLLAPAKIEGLDS